MKKNFLAKMISAFLVVVMVLGMTACGSKEETSAPVEEETATEEANKETEEPAEEAREEVNLVWYLHAVQIGPGLNAMTEAANAYLKEKLNTTIEFHYYPQAEFKQTVNTIFNSGTYMDIVTVGATGVDFDTNVTRGAFVDITDYVDEYLPITTSLLPEGAYDAYSYEGKVYGIPPVKDLVTQNGFTVNLDMMEDLGLTFPETFRDQKDLIDFFYEARAAKNEKYPDDNTPLIDYMISFGDFYYTDAVMGSYAEPLLSTTIEGLMEVDGVDDHFTIFNVIETPEYLEWAKTVRKLVADNIRSFDYETYDQDEVMLNEGAFLGDEEQGLLFWSGEKYDFKGDLHLNSHPFCTTNYMQAGGMAISAASEHVERALEVIEFVNADEMFATILRFGPEGEGWTDENQDGIVELTDKNADPASRWWYCWYGWITGGLATTKTPPGYPTNFGEILAATNQAGYTSSHLGFVGDTTNIQTEYAACTSIAEQYNKILASGQNDNVEELVEEYRSKLKAAGIDIILEEYQKQMDEWRVIAGK